MRKHLSFLPYVLPSFSFAGFSPRDRVLDVGCGGGGHLRELGSRGCHAVGVDLDPSLVANLRREGLEAVAAGAEDLPFPRGAFDGLVCSVVLPYTDERRAVREWSRVLRDGAVARVSGHGFGFSLMQLVLGIGLRARFYALRCIGNTWYYRLFGRRLPGWIGDTLIQSDRRMRKYFHEAGLEVESAPRSRGFLGAPVFLYYVLRKRLSQGEA